MAKIVVVTSGKGGVGKTTTSASFSSGLALRGFKTVVIDFDVGLRNLDLIMGCERRVVYDFINVINGEATLVIRAEKRPVDSRYSKIMHVMRDSEQQRPHLRRLGPGGQDLLPRSTAFPRLAARRDRRPRRLRIVGLRRFAQDVMRGPRRGHVLADAVAELQQVEALQQGHLRGAVLDVTTKEPLPADHPFWTAEGIIVLPHIGGGHPNRTDAVAALSLQGPHSRSVLKRCCESPWMS